jgi:RHS repeat-associated protein
VRSYRNADGSPLKINHFVGDMDSPAWVDEGGSYTRVVRSFGGVAGIYASAAGVVEWKITNLHGDLVATVLDNEPGLAATQDWDVAGRRAPEQAQSRYGWMGAAQRAADNPGDLIVMGSRLYNPATNRFLTVDPIYGGNDNSYEYCSGDSVNCSDISGALSAKKSCAGTYITRTGKSYSYYSSWWGSAQITQWGHNINIRCSFNHKDTQWILKYWGKAALAGFAAAAAGAITAGACSWMGLGAAACGAFGAVLGAVLGVLLGDYYEVWYDTTCPQKGMTARGTVVKRFTKVKYRWSWWWRGGGTATVNTSYAYAYPLGPTCIR